MEHLIFTTAREPLIATEVISVLSEHLKQNVNRDNRHDEKNFTVGSLKLKNWSESLLLQDEASLSV